MFALDASVFAPYTMADFKWRASECNCSIPQHLHSGVVTIRTAPHPFIHLCIVLKCTLRQQFRGKYKYKYKQCAHLPGNSNRDYIRIIRIFLCNLYWIHLKLQNPSAFLHLHYLLILQSSSTNALIITLSSVSKNAIGFRHEIELFGPPTICINSYSNNCSVSLKTFR